jgi:hypothetical protein
MKSICFFIITILFALSTATKVIAQNPQDINQLEKAAARIYEEVDKLKKSKKSQSTRGTSGRGNTPPPRTYTPPPPQYSKTYKG